MADVMSQDQVDAMIREFLPFETNAKYDSTPACPKCNSGTKRLVFEVNFPAKVKVISPENRVVMVGKIPANAIFCFSCASFFDHVDRTRKGRSETYA